MISRIFCNFFSKMMGPQLNRFPVFSKNATEQFADPLCIPFLHFTDGPFLHFRCEQLTELYRATDFFLEEGPEPEEKDESAPGSSNESVENTSEGPVVAVGLQTAGPSFFMPIGGNPY